MRCNDVIVITYHHVGGILSEDKNRAKCGNLTILSLLVSMLITDLVFDWPIIPHATAHANLKRYTAATSIPPTWRQ